MKKITFLVFLISPAISFAQVDFGSPTASAMGGAVTASAKDWEAIEINPANLGYKNNHAISMSILNVGINLEDNGVTVQQMEQIKVQDTLTPAQRQEMKDLLTSPTGLNINTTITWAALSFSIPKIGGFAISLADEIYAHVKLSQDAGTLVTDLLFDKSTSFAISQVNKDSNILKETVPQILDGTTVGGYQYRELNIDYGHKLLTLNIVQSRQGEASFENSEYLPDNGKTGDVVTNPLTIYGGFGIKPIWGIADYNGLASGGENIENGTYVYGQPGYTQNILSNMFHANGRGLGIDLGLSASYKKWKLGFSAIDLGKINWQNNSFVPASIDLPSPDSIAKTVQNNAKIFQYFAVNQAAGPNYTTELPSKFRSGISYQLTRGILLSGDFVAPLNNVQGNLLNPYYVVGAHINFFSILSFSAGYATEKGFGNLIPAGVFLNFLGGFEVFVATDDVYAFLNQGHSHVLSASFGIKLFGF